MKKLFFVLLIAAVVLWAYIALTEPITQEHPRMLTPQEQKESLDSNKAKGKG